MKAKKNLSIGYFSQAMAKNKNKNGLQLSRVHTFCVDLQVNGLSSTIEHVIDYPFIELFPYLISQFEMKLYIWYR
jgi:hypothetical protein